MSDTDSFIEEVSEEVRRDRLFNLLRRYGWIAAALVVLVVGGAAFNEFRKASERAEAQARGDALLAALEQPEPGEALASVATDGSVPALMLAAAALEEEGKLEEAAAQLDLLAVNQDAPAIYRDVATLKSVMLRAETLSADDKRTRLTQLTAPGNPLRLLAEEQLALIDIETGDLDAAAARLDAIESDAETSAGLRLRVGQLKLALGLAPQGSGDAADDPAAEGE
ncbi:hypothetical protein [Cognatishimia sp. MH4019]|uniref:hypothetical protein n=1 Tax=Cognatishimia sp. MH4019 TaxID=2854030 RepID=UPI001CD517C1